MLKDYPHGRSEVPKDLLATAFFAHSTEIVAKMAKVLGRADAAAKYAKLHQEIRTAFNRAYVGPDGTIKGDTQAGYALALSFNLLDEPLRPKAVEHLLAAIARYKGHLSTGIQSTHHAMLELTRNGRHDEAGRLICLRSVPSWGYMIDQGATTIWERWDGYVRGRGFQDPGMNSFNHWAFGAVGEWLWRELAGINPDEQNPGFKHFIHPPSARGRYVTWVNEPLRLDSRYDRKPLDARGRPIDARRDRAREHDRHDLRAGEVGRRGDRGRSAAGSGPGREVIAYGRCSGRSGGRFRPLRFPVGHGAGPSHAQGSVGAVPQPADAVRPRAAAQPVTAG